MSKYNVTITETLSLTVEIEAENELEAEQIANDRWHNSEYILDTESFKGVAFKAKKQEKNRDCNER